MNGFFEIIAEGAMLEAAVADKYLLTGVNEGNIKDYVSDKAFAAGQTIKKLYEKVMNAIDEVINKVLNYKDEKMLGFAAARFKKYKFDADKKTVEFRAEEVDVAKLTGLVDFVKEYSSETYGKTTTDDGIDDSMSKDDMEEIEKGIYDRLAGKIKTKFNKEVKIGSLSDIPTAIKSIVVAKEGKITLSAEKYNAAYDFITAKDGNSVASMLKKLRELKLNVKREYQLLLRDYSEEIRSIKKDSDDDRDVKNIKKNVKFGAKAVFNVYVACIIAVMNVIKDGVKYCKIMSKAIASKSEKKKSKEVVEKDNNSAALSFLESAMAEAELDLY